MGPVSMIVIDTHLARGASNGGARFGARGGPHGMTKGEKRIVAVDVTGLPVCASGGAGVDDRECGTPAACG